MSEKEAKSGEEELDIGGKPKKSKKAVIFAVLGVILLGVPAGLYFSGIFSKLPAGDKEEPAKEEGEKKEDKVQRKVDTSKVVFLEMEEFLVNLNSGNNRQPSFLKMSITLEIPDDETKLKITGLMPKVRDALQIYLRELRPDEVEGSSGLYHLREELLLRVNKAIYPLKVNNILFKDIQTR